MSTVCIPDRFSCLTGQGGLINRNIGAPSTMLPRKLRFHFSSHVLKMISPLKIPTSPVAVPKSRFGRRLKASESDEGKVEFTAREALDEELWMASYILAGNLYPNNTLEMWPKTFVEIIKVCASGKTKCVVALKVGDGGKNPDPELMQVLKKNADDELLVVMKQVQGTLILSFQNLLKTLYFLSEHAVKTIFPSLSTHLEYAYINKLVVANYARGQNIEPILLKFAIKMAQSNGIEHVFVRVDKNDQASLDLLDSIGFGVLREAYPTPDCLCHFASPS